MPNPRSAPPAWPVPRFEPILGRPVGPADPELTAPAIPAQRPASHDTAPSETGDPGVEPSAGDDVEAAQTDTAERTKKAGATKDRASEDRAAKDGAVEDRAAEDRAAKDHAAEDRAAKDGAAEDRAAEDRATEDAESEPTQAEPVDAAALGAAATAAEAASPATEPKSEVTPSRAAEAGTSAKAAPDTPPKDRESGQDSESGSTAAEVPAVKDRETTDAGSEEPPSAEATSLLIAPGTPASEDHEADDPTATGPTATGAAVGHATSSAAVGHAASGAVTGPAASGAVTGPAASGAATSPAAGPTAGVGSYRAASDGVRSEEFRIGDTATGDPWSEDEQTAIAPMPILGDGGPVPAGRARPVRPGPGSDLDRRRKRFIAIAVAVVVLLAVAVFIVTRGTEEDASPPNKGSASQGATGSAPEATTPTATATGEPAAPPPSAVTSNPPTAAPGTQRPPLPAGWREHVDRTGFSVYVPAHWRESREGTMVYFRGDGRTLGIDQTDQPKPDPVADWTAQRNRRLANGDFPGYSEIRIAEVPYFKKAADWEFTYNNGSTHVSNRGVIVGPSRAYGFWWQTSGSDWAAAAPVLQIVYDSFRPDPSKVG